VAQVLEKNWKKNKSSAFLWDFNGFQPWELFIIVYCFTKGEHWGRQASPSHTMREIVFHRAPGLFAHAELHRGQGGLVHLRSESASGPLATFEK
jgi:hypothetical protein